MSASPETLILGTAGHVDHGKTTLVRALTGTDTDRLREEHERGISIELGFAQLPLDDGLRLGIVDVPGHERFVRQMVAGAGGMDLAMLLVAADEGVMPQTREHLDVLRLLGVPRGLVVLTRMDLADPELADVVEAEVMELTEGTFLEDAPVVRVSATTGAGLDELRAQLTGLARESAGRSQRGDFRLPIDRVFVLEGTGTVVTGTAWSGRVASGDELRLLPSDRKVRVRGVQTHAESVEAAGAGERVAVALHGVKREEIERGMQLVSGSAWTASTRLGVRLTAVSDPDLAAWVRQRTRFHVHHAAREVLGRVDLLEDRREVGPGESAWARLLLEEPLVAAPGDRLVLRSYSPMYTVAGGEIVDPDLPEGVRRDELRRRLQARHREGVESWILPQADDPEGRALGEVVSRWTMLGRAEAELQAEIARRESAGELLRLGERLFSREGLEIWAERILERLRHLQSENPLSVGMAKEELREVLGFAGGPAAFQRLLDALAAEHPIFVVSDRVRADAATPPLDDDTRAALEALEEKVRAATPIYEATSEELAGPHLRLLLAQGRAAKLSGRLVAHEDFLEDLVRRVGEHFRTESELGIAEMKEWTGASRKFVVPLLEWLDSREVTRFDGKARRPGPHCPD